MKQWAESACGRLGGKKRWEESKVSASFLKKRSKKLLLFWCVVCGNVAAMPPP
jgi:hypothetical protein